MGNYLYNGLPLQDINTVWTDKETYPYAVITEIEPDVYALYIATNYGYGDDLESNGRLCFELHDYIRYIFDVVAGAWTNPVGPYSKVTFIIKRSDGGNLSALLWANLDIEYDGTLYLATSDPIPVNPATTLDPTALLMCWQVGNRIRGGA